MQKLRIKCKTFPGKSTEVHVCRFVAAEAMAETCTTIKRSPEFVCNSADFRFTAQIPNPRHLYSEKTMVNLGMIP